MTTIILDHDEIIYDSRAVLENVILTDEIDKHLEIDGVHFWTIGTFYEARKMAHAYMTQDVSDLDLDDDEDIGTKVIMCKENCISVVSFFKNERGKIIQWQDPIEIDQWAWGNGKRFALGAMDVGKSGVEAMKAAMKRDIYTGGQIRVFNRNTKNISIL